MPDPHPRDKFLTLSEVVQQRSAMVLAGPISQWLKVDADELRAKQTPQPEAR